MEPFKNWFNPESALKIASAVERAYPKFDSASFLRGIETGLEPLELKQRVTLLADRIADHLPQNPKLAIDILSNSIRRNENDSVGLSGFNVWPLTHFVMERGLDDFDSSMSALYRMTQVFTAEFAIRPFLVKDRNRVFRYLNKWAVDPSEHVRRLVSEGTRPLLPWGQRLPEFVSDPSLTWPLLEKLKNDPSKYVQKSVANHINDHSKNHGDWIVAKLNAWTKSAEARPQILWIIRHGTRTLVKKGHTGALKLHGIHPAKLDNLKIKVLTPNVKVGGALEARIAMKNMGTKAIDLLIDHEILFLKANGKHSAKVFKGTKKRIAAGESLVLDLRVPIRKVTTREYYPGKQGWAALINGTKTKTLWFELKR